MTSPDLISRDFTAPAPGQRLVGDITYLHPAQRWSYLATVIDLTTKMVTGWQLAEHMSTSLVTDALAMVITHGHIQPGAISTATGARQYTAGEFARFCQANGIRTSIGRTGVCWDNAAAESFFAALKNEMYYRQAFPDRARAQFGRRGLHRSVLQPPAAALHPRLPHPVRGTYRIPGRSNRCMINYPETVQDR